MEYYPLLAQRPEAVVFTKNQRRFHGQTGALERLSTLFGPRGRGRHAAVSTCMQVMVYIRVIVTKSDNRKKKNNTKKTFNPGLKKAQILHFSAGVTLRLYSGNRV